MIDAPAFTPLANQILIRRDVAESETAGGLVIPETARDGIDAGLVVCIGPDANAVPLGCRIKFAKYAGTDIELEGKPFTVLRETEVFGIEHPTPWNTTAPKVHL